MAATNGSTENAAVEFQEKFTGKLCKLEMTSLGNVGFVPIRVPWFQTLRAQGMKVTETSLVSFGQRRVMKKYKFVILKTLKHTVLTRYFLINSFRYLTWNCDESSYVLGSIQYSIWTGEYGFFRHHPNRVSPVSQQPSRVSQRSEWVWWVSLFSNYFRCFFKSITQAIQFQKHMANYNTISEQ